MRESSVRRPVVVADGDESDRDGLKQVLTRAGFDVIAVATGEDALVVAQMHEPALFILEVPLGQLSGYEVCRALRDGLRPGAPIIFLSGVRSEPYDRVAGLLLGADDYIAKPYSTDELLARVRRLTGRSRATGSLSLGRLTPRETEVLRLLAEGHPPDAIAARLFISSKTLATHIEHVLKKLDVKSRSQAIALAYREGLVERVNA
jgi:DNA-binding NarL/FixJ family response regulator